MITFQGKRVSKWWRVILVEASREVRFTLDSGQRTMGEQALLVHQKGVWSPANPHGAARPSPNAPHIRVGRQYHALDIDTSDGGHKRLKDWLSRQGVPTDFNVPGEPWHLDPLRGKAQLRQLYIRLVNRRKNRGQVRSRPHYLGPSHEAVDLIASFEGCVLKPYKDAVGVWTIGYGHTHGVNALTPALKSEKAARELLQRDVVEFAAGVRRAVKTDVTQEQFDALVSFAYNVGLGAFASSTLVKRLNKRRIAAAANQFLRWDKAGRKTLLGLSRRRRAERTLFLEGSDAKARRNAKLGVV